MVATGVPSPEATGGAGPSFEIRTFAVALARLLRGDRIPGLDAPPTRVRLQQRVAGAVLDDVVLECADRRGGIQSIEYQVKRRIRPTDGDPEFVEIVRRCLGELRTTPALFEERRRRFGIAATPSAPLRDLHRVTVIARSHDTATGFCDVVWRTAREQVRDKLTALRTIVATVRGDSPSDTDTDEDAWRVARALHIWSVDAEPDGTDVLATLDRLADLLPGGGDPDGVFRELTEIAQEWNPQAGATDLAMLRLELETRGVALDAAPARRAAFDRLVVVSEPLLSGATAQLGHRLHLPRMGIREQMVAAVEEHEVVVLGGRAGVGKSILARLFARDLRDAGAAVAAISLNGQAGRLGRLEADLGLSIADALAGAPIGGQRVLVIDGAEQALTDGGVLLGDLLGAIPVQEGSAPPWTIVLTARDEATPTLSRLVTDRTATQPKIIVIPGLTDAEVAEVVERFPRLAALARNGRSKALLLRRPYLVDLLARSVEQLELPGSIAGEEDLIEIVIERLVRRDEGGLPGRGAPDARADVYLALADAAAANEVPARLDGMDAEARAGLSSDDVITRIGTSWRFAHDVLADYAVATLLLEPDGNTRLAAAPSPRRLLRAVRLRIQRQLADALATTSLQTQWSQAAAGLAALEQADGPRWRDVPWEALLNLGSVRNALDILASHLFADDGAELLRLIDVTERLGRTPRSGDTTGRIPLDVALSGPVVDLLATHANRVPPAATGHAARLAHEHLQAAAEMDLSPDSTLEAADVLPDALVQWAGADEWGDRLGHVINGLAFCGERLAGRHDEFLARHARTRPEEVAGPVESPSASKHLARTRPDLLLRLAGLYYLGIGLRTTGAEDEVGERPEVTGSFIDDREGVRGHDLAQSRHLPAFPLGNDQANPALGPFAALLDASPAHGLRLVGALADAATTARAQLELGDDDERIYEIELTATAWPAPRHYTGTGTVWLWHRRTSVGPGPALSALMALRAWGVRRIRAGDPPTDIRDDILNAGNSLALVSVAISVLVDAIDVVDQELDMFLEHPLLWRLEQSRTAHEHGIALTISNAPRLSWTLENVAVALVLRSDGERTEELRGIGQRLIANHAELRTSTSEPFATGWANMLDKDRYVTETRDDGLTIMVNQPPELIAAMDESGEAERAVQSLQMAAIMMQAIKIRDGEASPDEATTVWQAVVDALADEKATGAFRIYKPGDVVAAAAAAVVRAAAEEKPVHDGELASAVDALLAATHRYDTLAPPVLGTEDAADSDDGYVPNMAWDIGADRSTATALPTLLTHPDLCARAQVDHVNLCQAIGAIATTPFDEARRRLVAALRGAWSLPCGSNASAHVAVLAAARRMIATAGLGPHTGHRYSRATLPEPFEDLISTSDGVILDLPSASFAVTLLVAGVEATCEHGAAARNLLAVLTGYDRRVWPTRYARRHYSRSSMWRAAIDEATVEQILDGDDAALDAILEAYAPVAEQLYRLLSMLPERALTPPRVERLHKIWPKLLDRLLPQARSLSRGPGRRGQQPHYEDVQRLDRALLLLPPANANQWPLKETVQLAGRWLRTYQSSPHVADRALEFLGRTGLMRTDTGIELYLGVLGDDITSIRRQSRYVMAWLEIVLTDLPGGSAASRARTLLDRLAAAGDDHALSLQQQLEA
ncbi:hypothetical protein K1W54_04135 [Micromonospora sp. CPCC 205371]|nr:hypothetical protein [Micromonospora sp. CPCC 205371]